MRIENGRMRFIVPVVFVLSVMTFLTESICAASEPEMSKGQVVYVPAYSHIYVGDKPLQFNLAVTLCIRNTDMSRDIRILSIEYRDSKGKLIRTYLKDPLKIGPLASADFFVKESDVAGGVNAHFLVQWEAGQEVNEPIIETIMIGARSGQGISFIGRGKVIGPSKPLKP